MLTKLLLLVMDTKVATAMSAIPTQHGSEADLVVDLLHTLEVCLCGALGSEDDVLSGSVLALLSFLFLQKHILRLAVERGALTISSRVKRFVSGTKNQMKAAPM